MGERSLTEIKMEEARQLSLLPEFPEVVALAEAWEPGMYARPSGAILGKDEELCEAIGIAVLRGVSDRKIARRYGVGRNSVQAIIRTLDRRGKLEPLKERLIRDLGEVAMMSMARMKEALEDDLVPPAALPIYAGVAIDKRELLSGGVTARVESRVIEPDLEGMRRALRAQLGLPEPAIEVESTVLPQKLEDKSHE